MSSVPPLTIGTMWSTTAPGVGRSVGQSWQRPPSRRITCLRVFDQAQPERLSARRCALIGAGLRLPCSGQGLVLRQPITPHIVGPRYCGLVISSPRLCSCFVVEMGGDARTGVLVPPPCRASLPPTRGVHRSVHRFNPGISRVFTLACSACIAPCIAFVHRPEMSRVHRSVHRSRAHRSPLASTQLPTIRRPYRRVLGPRLSPSIHRRQTGQGSDERAPFPP